MIDSFMVADDSSTAEKEDGDDSGGVVKEEERAGDEPDWEYVADLYSKLNRIPLIIYPLTTFCLLIIAVY